MTTPDFEGDLELMPYLTLDERAGPAPRISRDRAIAMVDTALAALPPPVAATPRLRGPRRPMLAVAAIVLGVAGAAAAARLYFADPPAEPPALAPPARPTAAPEAAAPLDIEVLDSLPEPTPERAARDVPRAARVERAAPEDLLQKANRLRTLGKFREAAQTYAAVSERYPRTLSAYVAQVAAAAIELEHLSNPMRARRLFERALREHPAGALDLEARQGLATALRDLGQESAEIDALHALIELHAGSPAARRAKLRLGELGVP